MVTVRESNSGRPKSLARQNWLSPPKISHQSTNLATNHLNRRMLAHPQLIDRMMTRYETLVLVQVHHELIEMHWFGYFTTI